MKTLTIPQYNGYETSNEDIVYSFFRLVLNNKGYSFRVKRTGYTDIDSIIPSAKSGLKGKGSCDAYFFSGERAEDFFGLLELESTGNIDIGIEQIRKYAKGFNSKSLTDGQKNFIKRMHHQTILLLVFDGQLVYFSQYNLETDKEKVIINREPVDDNSHCNSALILDYFPEKVAISREQDEKKLIADIVRITRGSEKIKKNEAFIMTILSSIYGQTKDIELKYALKKLKNSQVLYELMLYNMWEKLNDLVEEDEKIEKLYTECASELYELSQERGMDLYGFIYEELATKETKKEQGEYYTPRHTIRPLIAAVYENYLKWDRKKLKTKNVVDIFCGSGGFLYEYVHYIRKKYNLSEEEINEITSQSIYGFDKNGVLAAQLNMYLVGDGKANLFPVNTSINWRKHFLYKQKKDSKYDVTPLNNKIDIQRQISNNIKDINNFFKVYIGREFSIEIDDVIKNYGGEEVCHEDIVNEIVCSKIERGISGDELGKVDLLLTNVPYGKVTDATEQIISNGKKKYGNSLEANALHECIDLLRPAKLKGVERVEDGGVGIIIVPDSILENPTNKAIRDYMISRCDILAIISLPEFTFSPYAMEKTYAVVIQKLAPQEFNYNRELKNSTFMYYSSCDGRANSKNRYRTNHVASSVVKDIMGNEKKVNEFIHNDFEPCFEPYDNVLEYYSKLERAWNPQTYLRDPDWDQIRLLETWNGTEWDKKKGKKWGYFRLQRVERRNKKYVACKSLNQKIEDYFMALNKDIIEELLLDMDLLKKNIRDKYNLTATEEKKLCELNVIELEDNEIKLVKYELVKDVDMDIDSERYLGLKREPVKIEDICNVLKDKKLTSQEMIDLFTGDIVSEKYDKVRIMDNFIVTQGSQFSKEDAYQFPGKIPVYTAATDGPAYFVSENISGKTMLKGKTLIWSRKGAKAGTIQIFDRDDYFYISDVSGTIMPKDDTMCDLLFLKYYIEGQLKKERQSISNNAQLNKSKVENLEIYLPDNQKEIGQMILNALNMAG